MGTVDLLIAGLVVAVASAGFSTYQGIKASKAEKDARQDQQRQANLEARRQRRRTIRESRIARAQVINQAGQTGAQQSSGVAGGLSGLSSQTGENLGFSTQSQALGNRVSNSLQKAADARGMQSIAQGVGSIGRMMMSNAGAFG